MVKRIAATVVVSLLLLTALTSCAFVAELWPGVYSKVDGAAAEANFSDFGDVEVNQHYGGLTASTPAREQVVVGATVDELTARLDELGYSQISGDDEEQFWSNGEVTVWIASFRDGDLVVVENDQYTMEGAGVRASFT